MRLLRRAPATRTGSPTSLKIDIRKLGLFNRMATEGGNTVADHLSQMTGMETEMERPTWR